MSFPLINVAQFFDSSGSPLASGTIEFRDPTDDTYINTYPTADKADSQTDANANPLTLNARGEAATGIYLEDGVKYKITLREKWPDEDTPGTIVWTQDDVLCPIALPYIQTSAESAAGVTPTNVEYPPGDLRRYGGTIDGVADDGGEVGDWLDVGAQGVVLTAPAGTALCTTWTLKSIAATVRIVAPGLIIKGPDTSTDFISFTSGGLECEGVEFNTWDDNIRAGVLTANTKFELTNCKSKNSIRFFNRQTADINDFTVSIIAKGCTIDHSDVADATATTGFRVYSAYEEIIITGCIFKDLNGRGIALGYDTYADQDKFNRSVIHGNTFENLIMPDVSECQAIIVYGKQSSIIGNHINTVTTSDGNNSEGIYTKCRYATIADNTLIDAGEDEAAINIKGNTRAQSASPQGYAISCHDNMILFSANTGTSGIHVANEETHCHNNIIEGADTYGIYTENKALTNVKITNNTIRDCTGEIGIWIQNSGSGLDIIGNVVNVDHKAGTVNGYSIKIDPVAAALNAVRVNDNRIFVDDDSNATTTVRGIAFDRAYAIDDVQIIGNRLSINHSTATEYGINMFNTAGSDNWQIKNNDLLDVAANKISVTGGSLPTNLDYGTGSDGDTGGTGSAGAGNQYVEIDINDTIYKVLHDGTV